VTFKNNGDPDKKITIRGIRIKGKRPVLSGVSKAPVMPAAVVRFLGSHYTMEGFDITPAGDPNACRGFYNVADDVTLRDSVVHDCPFTGISGSDASGSLRLEYVEIYHCGDDGTKHQIYVASSNSLYPKAVFHMEFCYLHDGRGGNNIKSRVARTEIYFNWIEGSCYHELDLDGADPHDQAPGTASSVREDAEVVGNVIIKLSTSHGLVANIGGDSWGWSNGRYRFVNNTIILPSNNLGTAVVFQLKNAVQTIEIYNNLFYRYGGGPVNLLNASKLFSGSPCQIVGSNNWLPLKSTAIPATINNTITGTDPQVRNVNDFDFTPMGGGVLAHKGATSTPSPAGLDFPSPLPAPLFSPAIRSVYSEGAAVKRSHDDPISIGAYEPAMPGPHYTPLVAPKLTVQIGSPTATTISPLANKASADGISLTLVNVGAAASGSTAISGSNITYTPGSSFSGFDTFTYTLSDGYGIAVGTVEITYPGQAAASPQGFSTTPVALKDENVPNLPGAKFANFGNPAINTQGHMAFLATLAGVPPETGVTPANNAGIWADEGTKKKALIVRTGDVAQGTKEAVFSSLSDPVYNNQDRIAFLGTLKVGKGDAVAANATGIWCVSPDGFLNLVARQGQQAPGCPEGARFLSFVSLALPDHRGVVFLANLQSAASPSVSNGWVTSANNQGIWAVDAGGNVQLIARKGTPLGDKQITGLSFLTAASSAGGQSRSFDQATGNLVYKAAFNDKSTGVFSVKFQ